MKLKLYLFLLITSTVCLGIMPGCSSVDTSKHNTVVTAFMSKSIAAKIPLRLEMECGNGDIEVYSWNRKEAAFEITNRLTGSEETEQLKKRLEKFGASVKEVNEVIKFSSGYKGGGRDIDAKADVKLFIPKSVENIKMKLRNGKLKFLDDLDCSLDIEGDSQEVVLNSFEGYFSGRVKTGRIRISEGMLTDGSKVSLGKGSIHVKSELQPDGKFDFKTGSGIIELSLPADLAAIFETNDPIEAPAFETEGMPARVKLDCGEGRIVVNKY